MAPIESCLSDEELWAGLSSDGSEYYRNHINGCEECHARMTLLSTETSTLRRVRTLENAMTSSTEIGTLAAIEQIGKYRVCHELSSGGQGHVFLAWDANLKRQVAIKLGHRLLSETGQAESRIVREGILLAKISHPSLAQIFDAGVHDGYPYLVMEYVPGTTLQHLIESRTLDSNQIQNILTQVASAVHIAHQSGILHLDLKPENVIVDAKMKCKLIDFGIAWLLHGTQDDSHPSMGGTPDFMAPEQAESKFKQLTIRTDIYGLGALLHCMLINVSPCPEENKNNAIKLSAIARQGKQQRRLVKVCKRSLNSLPKNRYGSVEEFIKEMERQTSKWVIAMLVMGAMSLGMAGLISSQATPVQATISTQVPRRQRLDFVITSKTQRPLHLFFFLPKRGLVPLIGTQEKFINGIFTWKPVKPGGWKCEASYPAGALIVVESSQPQKRVEQKMKNWITSQDITFRNIPTETATIIPSTSTNPNADKSPLKKWHQFQESVNESEFPIWMAVNTNSIDSLNADIHFHLPLTDTE